MSEREPTIGPESKIKLGFLVPLIVAVAVPLILSYLSVRMELAAIRNDLQQIRQNMSDRWSGSMMILWAERLKHENSGRARRARCESRARGHAAAAGVAEQLNLRGMVSRVGETKGTR